VPVGSGGHGGEIGHIADVWRGPITYPPKSRLGGHDWIRTGSWGRLNHQSPARLPDPIRSRGGARRRKESTTQLVGQWDPTNGSQFDAGPDVPEGDGELIWETASVR
jgi:hypothetical protein